MPAGRSSALATFFLALLAGRASPSGAQAGEPALKMEPCVPPGVSEPARCGTFRVWENREARSGRTIDLRFVVIPGTGTARATEAVASFAGGPGQAATEFVGEELRTLSGAREGRDLLFVDGRGTGRSNPLPCEISKPGDPQSYLVEFFTVDGVRECARALAPRADLTRYTSAEAADDLEELRAALGYDRLDLYGVSYGTRTALVYLRRHPQRVRAVLMHGTVPTDLRYPLTVARDAQAAIDGVFADCARDPGCHAAFPDPAGDLRESLRRLDAGPAEADIVSPFSGEVTKVRLSRERFTEALRFMTYSPAAASLVPVLVHRAAAGDFGPAAEQALYWRMGLVGSSSRGLYLAVTCPEDVDLFDEADAKRLAEGTYLGDWRARDQKAACAAWPHHPAAPGFAEPVRSGVPLLVMNGTLDPATAPAHAERTLRGFPNGRIVFIPSAGHGTYGLLDVEPCYGTIVSAFIRTADAKAVDASCMERVRRPPFPLVLPSGTVMAVDSATLARYAGHYTGTGLPPVEMRVVGGRLHGMVEGMDEALVPVAPGRFRLLQMPHLVFAFEESGGRVTGFTVTQGGAPPQVYQRADAPSR